MIRLTQIIQNHEATKARRKFIVSKRKSVGSKRWMLALALPVVGLSRVRADDSVGISHQTYAEEHGRIQVNTETLRVQKTILPWMDVTINEVYDGITGATPTGAPPINRLKMRDPGTGELIPPSTITGYTRQLDGVSGASQSGPVIRAISFRAGTGGCRFPS